MDDRILRSVPQLSAEMQHFEEYLAGAFAGVSYVERAAEDLVTQGGKRLRPALVITSAMLGNYDRDRVIPLAAAIETMHAATLVHDDVIDGAETRRDRPALHTISGNHVAIYTGDYMLARSLRMLAACKLPAEEMSRLAYVIEQICSGDIAQYMGRSSIPGYRTYLRRIIGKTGLLFAAACATGAYAGQLEEQNQKLLWHFGLRLGAAFQIRDDLLDVESIGSKIGKPTGRDLMDGIITLPLLLASTASDFRTELQRFLGGDRNEVKAAELIRWARQSGSVARAKDILENNLTKCSNMLNKLPESEARQGLQAFVEILAI
ncbi:MAG: heptaprenyl diphosphate synthase component 2 [Clostridiales bacterium]|nr:heptaprenyl diphosphate synthase component 2 [Clostridiales bacterium]